MQTAEQKVQELEEILARSQAENNALTQALQDEQAQRSKLDEELKSMRCFKGLLATQDTDKLYEELSKKNGEIEMLQRENALLKQQPESTNVDAAVNITELQERNADLKIQLAQSEHTMAELRGKITYFEKLPPQVEIVNVVRPEYRTVAVENSEHIEKLRNTITQQQEDLVRLREQLALNETKRPKVEVIERIKYVEVPKVEIRTEQVENVDKINVLIMKVRDLEQELQKKDQLIAEWQAKCAILEQQPTKVDVRTIEVESSGRMLSLLEEMNELTLQKVGLQKRVLELENSPQKQIEYVDREVYIEVPQVEVQRIEVENSEQIHQLKRLLELRDQELDRARGEIDRCREAQRRLELQIQEALRLDLHGEVKSERLAETFVVPRVPLQVYSADPSDPIDAKLAEHLSTTMCRVPFRRKGQGRYEFGMLPVQMKIEREKLMVKATNNPEYVSFPTFMQMCEAHEFAKMRMDLSYPVELNNSSLNGNGNGAANGTVMPMREPMRSTPVSVNYTMTQTAVETQMVREVEYRVPAPSEGSGPYQSQPQMSQPPSRIGFLQSMLSQQG